MSKFKDKSMQKVYDGLLGEARKGELALINVHGIFLQTGNSLRIAFWKGYHHKTQGGKPAYIPRTMNQAAYAAGKDFRKENHYYVGFPTVNGLTFIDEKGD